MIADARENLAAKWAVRYRAEACLRHANVFGRPLKQFSCGKVSLDAFQMLVREFPALDNILAGRDRFQARFWLAHQWTGRRGSRGGSVRPAIRCDDEGDFIERLPGGWAASVDEVVIQQDGRWNYAAWRQTHS